MSAEGTIGLELINTPVTVVRCVFVRNWYIHVMCPSPKSNKERNDVLGVRWRAERPSTSIVVVVDGSEPLRIDI